MIFVSPGDTVSTLTIDNLCPSILTICSGFISSYVSIFLSDDWIIVPSISLVEKLVITAFIVDDVSVIVGA